ncbi:CobD/CbiB family cobalamin biosynthesis protein [Thermoproteus tenax]|uniref:CobD/CbiB family cobalamin biosynthesis protein n=1 Tax=Thermoproteus tenax TaxID=2271 RepID=UPI001E4ADC0A|nr:CobD/CbiB family cobalamin biosynthesis protein [Thermoproteus tenax]
MSRLIPPSAHPVALIYKAASRLVKRGATLRNALLVALFVLAPSLALYMLQSAIGSGLWQTVAEAYLLKLAFSESHILYPCWSAYSRDSCPRGVVQQFVRRDLATASCPHVASACIETAAESFVDSFVSPLFWYILLGLPGAWAQRIANTLDGLIGFRDWGKSGAPAAYLDTALNWIPARLSAGVILASALLLGLRPDLSPLRGNRMESKNARWPISAVAGALAVRLEKPGIYAVGRGPLPDVESVRRALKLLALSCTIYSLFALGLMFI